jgi:hypothetical protein
MRLNVLVWCVQLSTFALTLYRKRAKLESGEEYDLGEAPTKQFHSCEDGSSDLPGRAFSADLWDTAGQERFNSLHPSYYYGAHCCILVRAAVSSIIDDQGLTPSAPSTSLMKASRRASAVFSLMGTAQTNVGEESIHVVM